MTTHTTDAMNFPALPLPELADSLTAFRRAASAVLTDEQLAELDTRIKDFAAGPGMRTQETLREYAQATAENGSSWLADTWTKSYLGERDSLPLTTNVGFQLNLPTESTGLDRVIEVIRRLAAVHLQWAAGTLEPELGFKNTPISMDQYIVLNGGVRVPGVGMDTWEKSKSDTTNRFIGLMINGRMWKVPVTDSAGELYSSDELRAVIEPIVATPEPANQNFGTVSALGSGTLAEPYARMLSDEHNERIHTVLREMLFATTILLTNNDDAAFVRRATFRPGFAWVYKPFTYQFSLADDKVVAHTEHSMVDGMTLAQLVARVQNTPDPSTTAFNAPEPEELVWKLSDDIETLVKERSDVLFERAEKIGLEIVAVPRMAQEDLPFKISVDAQEQFIAALAQKLTYGRIRSAYQSVDMREYRAGRTDIIRPYTPELVELMESITGGTATKSQLTAALDAHRTWIKTVKAGQGYARHLIVLEAIGKEIDPTSEEFFTSEPVQIARENFLSTTSLGTDAQIKRFAFAPVQADGFGLNYTSHPDYSEYFVSYFVETTPQPEKFLENLQLAGKMFFAFIRSLPTGA